MLLLIAFVVIELRATDPLMPFSIFRLRTLRGADIVGLLIGMSLFSMFFLISLYLQDVMHYTPIQTGIAYLPLAVGMIVSAGIASQLVTRLRLQDPADPRDGPDRGGAVLVRPGARAERRLHLRHPRARRCLAAVGLGLAFVPVTIAAVTGTEPEEAGLASGLINTSQQVGGALGLAILATVANSRTQDILSGGVHSTAIALTKGFDRAFLIGAGFAVLGAILTVLLISSRTAASTHRQPPAPTPLSPTLRQAEPRRPPQQSAAGGKQQIER